MATHRNICGPSQRGCELATSNRQYTSGTLSVAAAALRLYCSRACTSFCFSGTKFDPLARIPFPPLIGGYFPALLPCFTAALPRQPTTVLGACHALNMPRGEGGSASGKIEPDLHAGNPLSAAASCPHASGISSGPPPPPAPGKLGLREAVYRFPEPLDLEGIAAPLSLVPAITPVRSIPLYSVSVHADDNRPRGVKTIDS